MIENYPLENTFKLLLKGSEEEKERAAQEIMAAGTSGDGSIVYQLKAAINQGDADARWWAVRALAGIPGAEAANALLAALDDTDEDVVVCAILGLGERKEEKAIDPLVTLLDTANEYSARHIGDALSKIGEPAVPGLLAALKNDRVIPRVQAARSLVRIESRQAIPALIQALDDPEPVVEHYAWEALQRMGVGVTVFFQP